MSSSIKVCFLVAMTVAMAPLQAAEARETPGQITGYIGAFTSEKAEIESLISGSLARTHAVGAGPVTILQLVSPDEWNPIAKQLIAGGVPIREDGVPYTTWLVEFRTQEGQTLWGDGEEVYSDCLGGALVTGPHSALPGCGRTPAPVPKVTIYLTVTSVCPGTKRLSDDAERERADTVDSARRWMTLASTFDQCGRQYVSAKNNQQAAIIFGKEAMLLGWAADELYHTDRRSSGPPLLASARKKFAYAKALAGDGLASQSLPDYYESGIMPAEQDYEP